MIAAMLTIPGLAIFMLYFLQGIKICITFFYTGKYRGAAAKKNNVRTNLFKLSYFDRVVDMWNFLPLSVRQTTTIANFEKRAREYLVFSEKYETCPVFFVLFR